MDVSGDGVQNHVNRALSACPVTSARRNYRPESLCHAQMVIELYCATSGKTEVETVSRRGCRNCRLLMHLMKARRRRENTMQLLLSLPCTSASVCHSNHFLRTFLGAVVHTKLPKRNQCACCCCNVQSQSNVRRKAASRRGTHTHPNKSDLYSVGTGRVPTGYCIIHHQT